MAIIFLLLLKQTLFLVRKLWKILPRNFPIFNKSQKNTQIYPQFTPCLKRYAQDVDNDS
jgi:hypothetical protein